jgi:hypothetical protein
MLSVCRFKNDNNTAGVDYQAGERPDPWIKSWEVIADKPYRVRLAIHYNGITVIEDTESAF